MAEGGWNDCCRPGNGKWFVWNEGSISLFAFPYPSQPSTVLSIFLHIPSLFPHLPHNTPHTTSPGRLLRHIPFHALHAPVSVQTHPWLSSPLLRYNFATKSFCWYNCAKPFYLHNFAINDFVCVIFPFCSQRPAAARDDHRSRS